MSKKYKNVKMYMKLYKNVKPKRNRKDRTSKRNSNIRSRTNRTCKRKITKIRNRNA